MTGRETYEAQRLAGYTGTDRVYRIFVSEQNGFAKKVAEANKQAAKLGVAGITVNFLEKDHVVTGKDQFGEEIVKEVQYVTVEGERPKLAGWEFMATIQHGDEAGNLLRAVPGKDDFDLSAFRHSDGTCDHCGFKRNRNNTFVVRHENGDVKRVGSTCVKDFLGGVDAHAAARYAEFLTEFDAALCDDDDERDYFGGGGGPRHYRLKTFLTHVSASLNEFGWVSRSAAQYGGGSTADDAIDRMTSRTRKATYSDQDVERAEKTIEFVRTVVANKHDKSDFEHNMTVAFANDYLTTDKMGFVAYGPMMHAKHEEREAELRREQKVSNHVGAEKERLRLTLTVESVFENEGHYGTTYITKLSDKDGNVFKWFGSYRLDTGDTVVGKWTVKGHGEWKGVKETIITRPALENSEQLALS